MLDPKPDAFVCMMCNHNATFHIYIKEMDALVCKVKDCKCIQHNIGMMVYSDKLLEELR